MAEQVKVPAGPDSQPEFRALEDIQKQDMTAYVHHPTTRSSRKAGGRLSQKLIGAASLRHTTQQQGKILPQGERKSQY